MLSQSNIDKLCMTGLYKCDPVLKWLPSYKRDNPYWCRNWTCKVKKRGDDNYMYDTYWASGDEHPVKLSDENFDKFELIFDFNDVEEFRGDYQKWITYDYDDRFRVRVDSGGINYGRYFVRKGAQPMKDAVIERLEQEIRLLENELDLKRRDLHGVKSGEKVDLRWV